MSVGSFSPLSSFQPPNRPEGDIVIGNISEAERGYYKSLIENPNTLSQFQKAGLGILEKNGEKIYVIDDNLKVSKCKSIPITHEKQFAHFPHSNFLRSLFNREEIDFHDLNVSIDKHEHFKALFKELGLRVANKEEIKEYYRGLLESPETIEKLKKAGLGVYEKGGEKLYVINDYLFSVTKTSKTKIRGISFATFPSMDIRRPLVQATLRDGSLVHTISKPEDVRKIFKYLGLKVANQDEEKEYFKHLIELPETINHLKKAGLRELYVNRKRKLIIPGDFNMSKAETLKLNNQSLNFFPYCELIKDATAKHCGKAVEEVTGYKSFVAVLKEIGVDLGKEEDYFRSLILAPQTLAELKDKGLGILYKDSKPIFVLRDLLFKKIKTKFGGIKPINFPYRKFIQKSQKADGLVETGDVKGESAFAAILKQIGIDVAGPKEEKEYYKNLIEDNWVSNNLGEKTGIIRYKQNGKWVYNFSRAIAKGLRVAPSSKTKTFRKLLGQEMIADILQVKLQEGKNLELSKKDDLIKLFDYLGFEVDARDIGSLNIPERVTLFTSLNPQETNSKIAESHHRIKQGIKGEEFAMNYFQNLKNDQVLEVENIQEARDVGDTGYDFSFDETARNPANNKIKNSKVFVKVITTSMKDKELFKLGASTIKKAKEINSVDDAKYLFFVLTDYDVKSNKGKMHIIDAKNLLADAGKFIDSDLSGNLTLKVDKDELVGETFDLNAGESEKVRSIYDVLYQNVSDSEQTKWDIVFSSFFTGDLEFKTTHTEQVINLDKSLIRSFYLRRVKEGKIENINSVAEENLKEFTQKLLDFFNQEEYLPEWNDKASSLMDQTEQRFSINTEAKWLLYNKELKDKYPKTLKVGMKLDDKDAEAYDFIFKDPESGKQVLVDVTATKSAAGIKGLSFNKLKQVQELDTDKYEYQVWNPVFKQNSGTMQVIKHKITQEDLASFKRNKLLVNFHLEQHDSLKVA